MAKGDGCVTEVKRRDGRSYRPKHWKVRIDRGTDPLTGKRRKPLTKTVAGTKAEAYRVRDAMRAEVEAGFHRDDDPTTFGIFAKHWQASREASGKLARTTVDRERGIVKLLGGYLGEVRLEDVTTQLVDRTIAEIRKDKIAALGRYSGATLNKVFKVLRQILDKAVTYKVIQINPARASEVPQPDDPNRRSLSMDEARQLLRVIDSAEEDAYEHRDAVEARRLKRGDKTRPVSLRGMSHISYVVAARVGLATGMRRGEVLGLTWDCIDLDGGFIRVTHSVNVYGELKDPKTKAGNRVIAVDGTTVKHLRLWHARQRDEFEFLGIEQTAVTPVCCSDRGTFINPNHFTRWWRGFADGYGFVGLKFHELRHTQATQLIAHGADMKEVQYRLGHASFNLTMGLYAHAVPENDRRAARLIGNLFSQPAEGQSEERTLRLVS